jgi:cbb3-type cytochrome c oxidase subunit III
MPAFGRDGMLKRDEIENVAAFVRTLSNLSPKPAADLAAGGRIFATRCASCHGAKGEGKREMGAPRLNDAIWLFGGDQKAIVETLTNGRAGVMPTWDGKLDEATLRSLAVYVGRWAAAATLIWIGLATLGLAPPLNLLDRALSRCWPAGRSASARPSWWASAGA